MAKIYYLLIFITKLVPVPSLMIYISYTQTRFTEDEWAKWSSGQSTIIPSNIYKGITTTHVVDNIVWKNKDLNSPETYNTNWILIQNCSDDHQFSQSVHVKPNYDFSRKDHKSFKAEKTTLPDINFKMAIPKLIPSIIEDDQNKEFQKSSIFKQNLRVGPFKGSHSASIWTER